MQIKKMISRIRQMHHRQRLIIGTVVGVVLLGSALIANTSDEAQAINNQVAIQSAHQRPAQIVTPESDLNTVLITKNAYQKLGIQVSPVKRESVSQMKTYGGEIMVPNGGKVTLSAPFAGKLLPAVESSIVAGGTVIQGQILFHIEPQLTPDSRASLLTSMADADSQVNTSRTQLEASKIALERAKKLLQDLVGSQRNVDEANASYEVALRNFEAASGKSELLKQMVSAGNVAPLEIRAPQSGVITNVLALPHQLLTNGMPILEISAMETLWVRVPVPSAELTDIYLKSEARVSHLANTDSAFQLAQPIHAPPTADPLTGTVNLIYAIPNQNATYKPGQRVSVTLNSANNNQRTANPHQRTVHQHVVVPWSSIVTDVNGGSWVYLMITETEYKRQRVSVDYVTGSTAVLNNGLTAHVGANIVTNGALELFAVETGFTH